MKLQPITNLWDFLELYMNDYSRDQRIADIDRLSKFINDEIYDPQDIIDYGFEEMTKELAHV